MKNKKIDDEFCLLISLLRKHINNHMDQWERWRITDSIGNTVYININYLGDGHHYDDLDVICPRSESSSKLTE
jgi:hypothetical protein